MRTTSDETERVKRIWNRDAARYDRQIRVIERFFLEDGRAWVCSRARGNTLEVAIGTGRNLAFYPEGIQLTGVDVSSEMLKLARARADALKMAVDLREGDAHRLAFPDASFDSVVCTLSLCNIPDERRALLEMKRVLRPGGPLILLDHVRGSSRAVRAVQGALEMLTMPFGGDHLRRRPYEQVLEEGFELVEHDRSKWGVIERLLARKPT